MYNIRLLVVLITRPKSCRSALGLAHYLLKILAEDTPSIYNRTDLESAKQVLRYLRSTVTQPPYLCRQITLALSQCSPAHSDF